MFLQFNSILAIIFIKLLDGADSSGGGGSTTAIAPGGDMSKEDMIDFLNTDDDADEVLDLTDKPKDKNKGKSKSSDKEEGQKEDDSDDNDDDSDEEDGEKEDKVDELDELEAELEKPSSDKLELIAPARRKDILGKYPNLFKDFPYLERAYYREQAFTELLPTIDDAKEAVGKAATLDKFEEEIINNGSTLNILRAVKEENPESFHRIADNYLATLAEVDKGAYLHVLGNVIKHTVMGMVKEGQRLGKDEKGNDNILLAAAQILNQYAFGTSEFSPPTNLTKQKNNDDNEGNEQLKQAQEREQKIVRTALSNNINELNTRVTNAVKNTIMANIDPKESMTEYVRNKAADDAMEMLTDLMSKDTRFKALNDKLWQAVIKSNFSRDSIDKVRTAHLSKAKTLLPSVIQKARNTALKGMGKRVRETNDESSTNKGPGRVERPRSSNNSSGKVTKPSEIPKGMRTIDFLNMD